MSEKKDEFSGEFTPEGGFKFKAIGAMAFVSKGAEKIGKGLASSTVSAMALLAPERLERASEALAYRHVQLEGAKAVVNQIQDGTKTLHEGKLIDVTPQDVQEVDPSTLIIQAAERERIASDLKKEIVVAEVATKAAEMLEDVPDDAISDEPLGDDWALRWKQHVKNVTTEDAKELWAKLLAEEVKKPDTVSYQAMDFLNTASRQDLQLLEKLSKLVLNDFQHIFIEGELREYVLNFIGYDNIMYMQSRSLIYGLNDNNTLTYTADIGQMHNVILRSKLFIVFDCQVKRNVNFKTLSLTPFCRELMKFTNFESFDDVYEDMCAQVAIKKFNGVGTSTIHTGWKSTP